MARRAPRLVIAAGGTGGHLFPAQALAEEMLTRGWQVTLSTDSRGATFANGFPMEVTVEPVAAGTFARGTRSGAGLRLLGGATTAAARMLGSRPRLVVGFGGYPSLPAMSAAWTLRLPRLLHEANAVLGEANRRLAPRVHAVACGTWPTELPAGIEGIHVGNPVRRAVRERAGAGYIPPGDHPMSLLVIGGSQGARVLSQIVPQAVAELPEALRAQLRVAHQAREEDGAETRAFYAEHGIDAEVAPFFPDLARRMSEAQLVISRAGASSIADISVIGRPSILVPLASALRDEQTANARGLYEAGAAIVVPESKLAPTSLAEQMATVLENPEGAQQMARAALGRGRPDAAERLADLAEDVAMGKVAR